MPAVPLIDKAALICCVEYMRNSKKASPLISNLEKHKFDARAAVGDTFPGEELWISVSSTSNVDTLSLRPCHLVGYFNTDDDDDDGDDDDNDDADLKAPQGLPHN